MTKTQWYLEIDYFLCCNGKIWKVMPIARNIYRWQDIMSDWDNFMVMWESSWGDMDDKKILRNISYYF